MRISIYQLSALFGRSMIYVQRVLNEMERCGLISKVSSKDGNNVELTKKAQEIFSLGFQALYKEIQRIPQLYRVDSLLILSLVKLSLKDSHDRMIFLK